jgi:hypothetical protein
MGWGRGESYLFLRLHGALQVRLDARLEVLDLLALEALQFAAHQAAHVVEEQPRLVDLALCVGDIGAELVEAVLLRATLAQELVLVGLSLLEILLGRVPRVVRLLSLLEGCLDGPDQADVLVDYDAHGEDVLLGLAFVEFPNADLDVGEAVEGAREGWRELDGGERVQRGREVPTRFCETLALHHDSVGGLEERPQLSL